MQILRQSTEVIVRVGPFVDVGDGFTPQTDITLGGNEAELLKAASVEVDISGRTWAATTNCRGWYDLTLTTDDTDTIGILTVVIQDDSDCLPVFRDFQVLEEAAYDSLYKSSAVALATGVALSTAQDDIDTIAVDVAGLDGAAMKGTDNAALADKVLAYTQLLARSDEYINSDRLTELNEINANEGSGAGNYDNEADSQRGISDVVVSNNSVVDTIAIDVAGLDGAAMRGTDSAALAAVCTEARLAELAAANLPTDVAAIPTTPMRGTDDAAIATKQDTMETTLNAIPTTPMRGTDDAALASKQDTMETTLGSIPTTPMRGTDDANTTTPPTADAIKTALEADGSKLDHLHETTEDDAGVRRFTENALEEAPAGGGGGDATIANQTSIINILEADWSVDITTTPWQIVGKIKGTATELIRKDLFDTNGNNVTSTTGAIGRHTEP